MCLQCEAKAKIIKRDILPGYSLMISRSNHPDWPVGHYGLVRCNDPDFVFKEKPVADPGKGVNLDLEKNSKIYAAWEIWAAETESMETKFTCSPELGHALYKACLKAGWRPKRDGLRLMYWLRNYMGIKLKHTR